MRSKPVQLEVPGSASFSEACIRDAQSIALARLKLTRKDIGSCSHGLFESGAETQISLFEASSDNK